MKSLPLRRAFTTLLFLVSGVYGAACFAQKPEWVPVAELFIGSMGESDAVRMSEVMHRCTALNMTLAALLSEESPELSKGYEEQALQLIQNGILIAMNTEKLKTGIDPDIEVLSGNAVTAVKEMLGGYHNWLNHNYNNNGSYIDKEFEVELKGCELASKFIRQMSHN